MKKRCLNLPGVMMFVIIALTARLAQAQTITIDGDFSDWNSIPYVHTNAEGESTGGTLTAIKAIAGTDDIFFYLEGTETLTFGQFDLYINTDNNPATGFQPDNYPAGAGAELLIQGTTSPSSGGINTYTGTGGNDFTWGWLSGFSSSEITFSSLVSLSGKQAIEFSIKKSILGTISDQISFALTDVIDWNPAGTMPANNMSTSGYIQISTIPGTLPVTLTSFEAISGQNSVQLFWKTASEVNNLRFDIYRSVDGINFEKTGYVNGNNNSSTPIAYTFTDQYPPSGQLYYRLAQVDANGKTTVFNDIATVKIAQPTIFNIAKLAGQNVIQVNVYSERKTSSEFQLADITGRKLIRKPVNLVPGYQTFTFPLTVHAGINIATLRTPSETLRKKVFIR